MPVSQLLLLIFSVILADVATSQTLTKESLHECLRAKPGAQIREYIIFNYRSIAKDIIEGRGEYLDALLENLGYCGSDTSQVLIELESLLIEKKHPASFSIAVSELKSEQSGRAISDDIE